ncbi:MAG: lysophospholipid acyltransferase family protein [Polyangiaceae bacterium]
MSTEPSPFSPGALLALPAAVRDWLSRAAALMEPEDRKLLLPTNVARVLVRRFEGRRAPRPQVDPSYLERDPELISLFGDFARGLATYYFRSRVHGVENVPREGPALLVGNHSGGIVTLDSFLASAAIADAHGQDRVPYALGHDILFDDPRSAALVRRIGILPAGHASARLAFQQGSTVLVYPGSDWDAFRPFKDRNKIVLAGRTGFLKLALRERVPIVPVVSAGSHTQMIVLTRGDRLARLIGLHRLARINTLPIMLAFPMGITSGLFPYIPFPVQVTIGFGEPISFPDIPPSSADDPEALDRAYREVESRMQSLLDRMVHLRAARA